MVFVYILLVNIFRFILVYKDFYPFLLKKIKEHQNSIDEDNPRDYLDFLLSETSQNQNLGWHSLIFTSFSLYLGGSDTIATTMRWILVCFVQNENVQKKSREEILKCLNNGNVIDRYK